MTLLVYRRRFWILLVPIINLVFLLLFIFSPSSLPRLPQRWTRFSRLQSLKSSGLSNGSFEQISFQKNGQPQDGTDPSLGVNYLLEQRKLVEGVYLKPLPDHLITTYRPRYLDPSGSVSSEQQEQENIDLDPTTKYLTFLPHSGFHNQRSELENALLLARLLNRTLIMPKVYLGPPMPWLTFSQLHARLLYQTKIGLDHCRAILENQVEEELESGLESKDKNNEHEAIKEDHQLEQQQQQQQQQQQSQSQSQSLAQPQPQSELQESQQQQPENHSSQHHHHHRYHHQYQRPLHVEEDPFQIGNHQDDETVDEEIEFTTATPTEEDASRDHSFGEEITSSDIPLDALYRPREEEDEEDADTDLSDIEVGQQWREEENEQDEEEEDDDDMKEDMTPSWFEEPEDDDLDQFMIATGDSFGDMMDLEGDDIDIDNDVDDESDEDQDQDVQDWEAVEESEEGEGDDEVEEIRVGIVDDDDDEDIDWPESFALPAHPRTRRRSRSRMSLEIEDSQESLSIDNPLEVDSRETHQQMWKRSLPEERNKADQEADATPDSAPSPQSLQEHQMADQDTLQGQEQQSSPTKSRRGKWNPLPAECLQYESWTMTDWDLFFDLNTLRRYVRVVTRESMSIAYLHDRFNLEFPMEEEPPKSNSTTAGQGADTASSIDSESDPESVGAETDSEDDSKDNDGGTDSGNGGEEENDKKKMLSLRTVGDILFFDDTSLYDYRFTENPEEAESQRTRPKFVQEFTIEWLAQRPERLIHLGSIFGSGRVSIDSLKSRAWHQMIRDHLTIRTEILQTTSQRIADRIRGSAEGAEGTISGSRTGIQSYGQPLMDPMEAGFVGIHVRMSDGHFSLSARDTIENIRQELMWQMDISDEDEGNDSSRRGRLSIEQCRTRALSHHRMIQEELQKQQPPQDPEPLDAPPLPQGHEQQHVFSSTPPNDPLRRSNGRYTPIYLATDAHRPRENAIFDRLFETFNCVFTLDDFSDELAPLYEFRNPEDGTLMAKFLIPMVDAMVVAKAGAFFGTPASTFSNYIQKQLRPAYTGLYD